MRQRRLHGVAVAIVAALLAASGNLIAQPLTITHFAGSTGGSGWFDGIGSAARFYVPTGVAVDAAGNVYVGDTRNHTIREISPATGEVTTLAGLAGNSGSADGTGSAARFSYPSGVAVDGSGNLYIADTRNSTIRKINPSGVVSTLAGLAGSSGSADGTGSEARFDDPLGVVVDGSGNVYVADSGNSTIRKVTPAGAVSTLAGLAGTTGSADGTGPAARFHGPSGVAVDASGNVYVADQGNNSVRMITPSGVVSTIAGLPDSDGSADGTGSAARFWGPWGVAADGSGNLYVSDFNNGTIRKIDLSGVVSTLAGLAGSFGSADGTRSSARFRLPAGVATDSAGNIYVADYGNGAIRKVTPSGIVSTLAGWAGSVGSVDGKRSAAQFYYPSGVAVDGSGNVYVADHGNHTIRKVTPSGAVSTLAGLAGHYGSEDGMGSAARFNCPAGVAVDGSGNVYVADTQNNAIRKVTPGGVVSTFAGLAGHYGSVDGTGSDARFSHPSGVAADGSGNVYVADRNSAIRKITPFGVVSTLAGLPNSWGSEDGTGSDARFYNPSGIAVDGSGNVYVADTQNSAIRKVTPAGVVSTLAGLAGSSGSEDGTRAAARFYWPEGVAVDGSGNVYVADTRNSAIRKVTRAGVVSTVAGLSGSSGSADGTGSAARFLLPTGIAVAGSGVVFVADAGNNCILKGTAGRGLADAATIDASSGPVGQARQLDTWPRTATQWLWEEIRRPHGSTAILSSTTIRNPTFIPDVPDLFVFRLTASDSSGAQSFTTVSLMVTVPTSGPALTRLLPVVVDVSSGDLHYTTEMSLGNNTLRTVSLSMLYTPSLGSKQGSGTVTDSLAPGEQKNIADVLSYLRDKGLAIPPSAEQPSQGGTLLVTFQGYDTIDPRLVSVTARTAALTAAPHPRGRAGLAYSGLLATEMSTSSLTLFGLRSTSTDRTNVAVFNTSGDPVTLKVTVHSGSGDGRSVVFKEAETLPPYGWLQYGSNEILGGTGILKGWVTVERTSATGSFSAYAVINDNATNDGSFVPPVGGAVAGSSLTVPVLTETPDFRSELILANKSASSVALTLHYVESRSPDAGSGGTITVPLGPLEEQIIPEAIDFLRTNGVNIGARDAAAYVGALRITVSGTATENVFAGARTASKSPAGGQFGLFTPCVYSGQEASTEAFLYGLHADAENRTNVALVNTGTDSDGPILLQLQAYDGDAGGIAKGTPASITLWPGIWDQPANFFRSSGVANGWVKITRMSGTASWITYGVVNDGGNPGERTGDGAYVPMVK